MEELNILNQVFPEIQLTNGINQGGLHDKDVYMHSLATLYFIENICHNNVTTNYNKSCNLYIFILSKNYNTNLYQTYYLPARILN